MTIIKNIFFTVLSILLGLTFIYSAYTKTLPIQTFEYTLVEFVHMPWWMAAFGSRAMVGLEAGLGVLILLNIYGKNKWILKVALYILLLFSVYLIYLWATAGNNVNCGCFGDVIWMSPSSSLIKNAILIAVALLLIRFAKGLPIKWAQSYGYILLLAIIVTPLFIYPLPDTKPGFLNEEAYKIDLSALYEPDKPDKPEINLSEGKHIIAFLSLTCPHCRMAAYKMHLMKKDNPSLPIYFVLNGSESNLAPFWEETGAESIPHSMLLGKSFIELSGLNLPAIYWVNNGVVEAKSDYITLNQSAIENWVNK